MTYSYLYRMKILMVCHGNICRSPLAEGILRDKVRKAGLDWEVDSAGTNGYEPGCAPHSFSQNIAKQNGIDISAQKCRDLTKDDLTNFDMTYVMDEENYDEVKRISGKNWDANKVDFLLNSLYPHQNRDVPDPWSRGEDSFHKVYKMIDEACEKIVSDYKQEIKN